MNIGLFGGSFDPIHRGHLALAQAAASRYALRQVLFVAANVPPHKQKPPVTAFIHRYAMVALATQDERRFVPSLLEAPEWATAELRSAGQPRAAGPTQMPKAFYRRQLPHLQRDDKPHFLTFCTYSRWILPENIRSIVLDCCIHDRAQRSNYSLPSLCPITST